MITFDITQTYPFLFAVLCIITGGLLLWVDVKVYNAQGMMREKKWTQVLGWVNIAVGFLMLVIKWVYSQWFWS
ncbi:CLC_0170 family protein [Alicyclobacillus fastidiosus]|uniref:Uncharacterized protein n=1 Tax=Alicyclobacillus fastidiosus TaxID=392011 RepID=A0ABV5ALQ1_9BACL|nr:CLC_0170 family protein [Alicyclobacillus fastidiosus]WEH11028.1 hypothetical protein PYS47_07360 [Alicyclobacillus fastidiosus]